MRELEGVGVDYAKCAILRSQHRPSALDMTSRLESTAHNAGWVLQLMMRLRSRVPDPLVALLPQSRTAISLMVPSIDSDTDVSLWSLP